MEKIIAFIFFPEPEGQGIECDGCLEIVTNERNGKFFMI
jgi:hypothetical protein